MSPETEESIKLVLVGILALALAVWYASTFQPPAPTHIIHTEGRP